MEDPASPAVTRLRLDITYDGTDFSGWAVQPGRRTVAGSLSEALTTLFRAAVPLVVAGRTDAGVHAVGQVAHIDVDTAALRGLTPRHLARPASDGAAEAASPEGLAPALVGLRRRLAGLLPPDVRVPGVSLAPEGFDARFSALRRHYRYSIICSDWGAPPLRRTDVITWRRPLDVERMNAAAAPLVGLHDFAAYCKPRPGATTIRDLQSLTVQRRVVSGSSGYDDTLGSGPVRGPGAPELVDILVSADAFCHSMVRSLVGALVAVGEERTEVGRPAELLREAERTAEIAVAPAAGLTLVGVDYPADGDLAARAVTTRAVRGNPEDCLCDGG